MIPASLSIDSILDYPWSLLREVDLEDAQPEATYDLANPPGSQPEALDLKGADGVPVSHDFCRRRDKRSSGGRFVRFGVDLGCGLSKSGGADLGRRGRKPFVVHRDPAEQKVAESLAVDLNAGNVVFDDLVCEEMSSREQ